MGFQRQAGPMDRNEVAAARYAEAVLGILAAEYRSVPSVWASKSVGISRVRKILARSSADALLGMVLERLIGDGLVRIDGEVVRFEPALIERWESGTSRG